MNKAELLDVMPTLVISLGGSVVMALTQPGITELNQVTSVQWLIAGITAVVATAKGMQLKRSDPAA